MMSEPFSEIANALLAALKADSSLSTLTRVMNIVMNDGGPERNAGLSAGDLPALRIGQPVDSQAVARTSRATRFHLRYPVTVIVERSGGVVRMHLLKWRVLLAIQQAGQMDIPGVVRVSPGKWFTPEFTNRGRLMEQLMIEVDIWVPHRDPAALGD